MTQVSVVIPVYNIEQHLQQCLDSLMAQTLSDLEIICVNDGSTDTSLQILEKYAAYDNRLQVVSQTNSGPGVARNAGMELATGKYIIFLDSDDWFEPSFLEKLVNKAEHTKADVTICRAVEFDTDSSRELPSEWMLKTRYLPGDVFAPKDIAKYIFQFTYGMPWDKLYLRSFIFQSGLRFPALRNSEDLAFVFPSLLSANRIAILDEVLLHHRINRLESVSNSRCSYPDAPYEALSVVNNFLKCHKLLEQYKQSFLNWAMEFLVWHVSNMGDKAVQKEYFKGLRKHWFPEFAFGGYPRSYYYSSFTFAKYYLTKFAPFFLFRAVLLFYKGMKQIVYIKGEGHEY